MALNPLIPIAALGALGFVFLSSKKSDAKTNTTPEGQGGPPLGLPPQNNTTPAPLPPPVSTGPRPTSELSEAQRARMAEALGRLGVSPATGKLSGAADAAAIQFATQVIGELEAANFKEAAAILRGYTDEAAKAVQTPPEAAPIAQAATGAMTKEQAEYVARVLSLERDPNKIGLLIDWLKKLAPSPQRDVFIQMAQALALQLEAANITTDTLDKIDQVITSTPEEPEPASPPVYTPPPSYTATSPGLPTAPPQPLPEQPAVVPPQPVPQPTPKPLTDAEIVARQVHTMLTQLQSQYGVKGAKGKEDKALVKKFQSLVGLGADGAAGPGTFLMLAAKGAVTLPLVYYWPKTATAATVAEYRTNLEKIAQKLEQAGRRADANTLRASIAREHGEGGINGPLYGAPAAAARPATPAPAPRPAAAAPAPAPMGPPPAPSSGLAVDPYPNWPLLKRGAPKSDMVRAIQRALNNPGSLGKVHYAGIIDGDYGGGTESAVRAFQRDAGMVAKDQDGQVGPKTRLALRKFGKW